MPTLATPQYLYKYRHLSRENKRWMQELLEQRKLYFPSPDEINDPFDCKVSLTTIGSDDELRARLESAIDSLGASG